MKKLLSIILVLAMALGIGTCGAVQANAGLGDLITGIIITESLLDKMPLLTKIGAYDYTCRLESLRPEMEAGLLPGKTMAGVAAALDSAMAGLKFDNFLLDVPKPELEQILALCDQVYTESFTSAFLTAFYAYRNTYSQAMDLYFRAVLKVSPMLQSGALLLRPSLMFEVMEWLGDSQITNGPDGLSTLAELTAFYEGVITRINTTMAKINGSDGQKWWQRLPAFVQWLLRVFLFGWIWMR